MPNSSSLARLEVPEKFVWWVVGGVGFAKSFNCVEVVLRCVVVGVVTTLPLKTLLGVYTRLRTGPKYSISLVASFIEGLFGWRDCANLSSRPNQMEAAVTQRTF